FADRCPPEPGLVVCSGEAGAEQHAAARLYAALHGNPVLALPRSALSDDPAWPSTRARIRCLARLAQAFVVLDDSGTSPADPSQQARWVRQLRELAGGGFPLIWLVPSRTGWQAAVVDLPFVELALP